METSEFEIEEDIKTFFMSTDQVPAGIPALFEEFEKKINGFECQHLYGVSECVGDKLIYRACALENFEDEANQLNLSKYNIPKGIYISTVFKNWRENLQQMPQTFCELLKLPDVKGGSICLEDYTSPDEMLLMVQHK
ncbi:MAG TPA: hypothetical protein VK668_12155 [Mucilaginibacter sp.]|nr:hypothetical protein [Mucilaginibacter sp.]